MFFNNLFVLILPIRFIMEVCYIGFLFYLFKNSMVTELHHFSLLSDASFYNEKAQIL